MFGITANSAAATSPSEMKRMLAPTSRSAATASSWRGRSSMITVTSPGSPPLRSAIFADHVLERLVEAEQSATRGPVGDLLHVDAGAGVEHRPALGEGDHRQRRGHPARGQRRALERVDGDVDDRRAAVADLLAVVEHRRLVLLALADHDDAVHRHRVEHQPHRVDGGAVGALLLAAADPAAGGERPRLGHPDQLEREVAVRLGAGADVLRDDVVFGGLGHCAERLDDGQKVAGGFRCAPPPLSTARKPPAMKIPSEASRAIEVAEGEADADVVRRRLVDEAVVGDQDEGGEADDRGQLAARPGELVAADDDPGEDDRGRRGRDQQPAQDREGVEAAAAVVALAADPVVGLVAGRRLGPARTTAGRGCRSGSAPATIPTISERLSFSRCPWARPYPLCASPRRLCRVARP